MKINQIGTNIIHIVMPDKNSLAELFFRFQEYYESPFKEIRNKIFTRGYLKSMGSRSMPGINTYCGGNTFSADWSGYNFPGYVLDPFISGLFDPLTNEEKDLVELLRYRTDKFYVIGTYGDDDPRKALEHEIRHALYYVNSKYREEVDKILGKYKKDLQPLKKCLSEWGYCDEVLDDECHAYMGPDYDWFFSNQQSYVEKYKIKISKKLSEDLNKVAEKYKKQMGIQK